MDGDRTRVLVADDNETYGALLSRFVATQPDMDVVGLACNGGDAVHFASLLRPDVVLMDLYMPGLNGFEATKVLADTHKDVKVIGITAHRSGDSERRCLEAGAKAFLPKTDVDARLIDTIRGLARGDQVTPPGPAGGLAPA